MNKWGCYELISIHRKLKFQLQEEVNLHVAKVSIRENGVIDVLSHKNEDFMSNRDGVKSQLDGLRAEMCHRKILNREM